MPPESLNYLFALARTGYRSECFSDFGKVTKISIQTSITKKVKVKVLQGYPTYLPKYFYPLGYFAHA